MQTEPNRNGSAAVPTVYDETNIDQPMDDSVSPTDIIPHSALASLVDVLRDGSAIMAIHEQVLLNEFPDAEMREMLADAYYGREPRSLKAYIGKTVVVHGMILYEQPGGWKGKDQLWHPDGYFQVRMLIEDTEAKGEPLTVIKSSGSQLGRHVYHILRNKGWYLFAEPISYRIEVGEDNAHRITNVSRDLKKALLSKRSAR